MAFHDVRLPVDVERGANGGPRFKTTVMILGGGYEKRNIEWEQTKGSWDVGYGIDSKEAYSEVVDFFYVRQGRAHTFRFRDWADYEIGTPGNPVSFATGDSSTKIFQLKKRYTSGGIDYDREITKPVSGTVELYVNGVLQTETAHYTIDYETGLITFVSAPGAFAIAAACEFDVHVRFDTDELNVTVQTFDTGSLPEIPVVEVRE